MAARVRLRIRREGGGQLETVAVLNGGFESGTPCLLLPSSAARRLFPDFPKGSRPEREMTAAGPSVCRLLDERVRVAVTATGRDSVEVGFEVLVSETVPEVLVSDSGIDALGLAIVSFGRGLWRFRDESVTRESETPEEWGETGTLRIRSRSRRRGRGRASR